MTKHRIRAALAASAFLFVVSGVAQVQEKGGGDETGPYDLVTGWPQNYCGEGHIIGSTAGIWAESPDRVYIFNRGCLPVLKDERGAAESFIPARNASGYDLSQKDPARHPRWDHVFNVVDRDGKLVESWESTTSSSCGRIASWSTPTTPNATSGSWTMGRMPSTGSRATAGRS